MPDPARSFPGARRAAGCLISLALGLAAALALLAGFGRPVPSALAAGPVLYPGSAPCDTTLQACIDGTAAGNTIQVQAGTYTESLTLNNAISLTGVSSATVILKAISSQRVLTVTGSIVDASVVISGLTFTGGDVTSASWPDDCGGGVQLADSAQPLLANIIITGNHAGTGGGLCAVFTSPLSLANSLVQSNTANTAGSGWGGGVYASYPTTLSDVRLQGNQCLGANCFGGGVATSKELTLTNATLISNTSQGDGGGAYSQGSPQAGMVVSGGLVAGNVCAEANCAGGGLDSHATLSLTGTQFISNTAGGGAGGLLVSGAATVTNALFEENNCTQNLCDGGAVSAGSALTLSNTQVLTSSAGRFGGGVRASNATLLNTVFQNNVCTQSGCEGGGLWVSGSVSATATNFTSNTATSHGGALYAFGTGFLSGGTFQNNLCTQSGCLGGAVLANGNMALTGTQFVSNTDQSNGGALYALSALALTNTQFLSNTAPTAGGGAYAGSATTVSGGLFENNQCTTTSGCNAGGLYAETLTLSGTHFLSNTAHGQGGAVFVNQVSTLSNALFQDNACSLNDLSACDGGGLYSVFGVTLSNTDFLTNTAQSRGGALYTNLAAAISGGAFLDNTCTNGDCLGGAAVANGPLAITGTQFISNSSGIESGALEVIGPLTLSGGLFQANACTQANCEAGALRADDVLVVSGTQFFSNTSQATGAAVVASGATTLSQADFEHNACAQANCQAGALLAYNVTLNGVTFANNSSQRGGGAVQVSQAVTLTGGLFQSNACELDGCQGGGLAVDGSLALSGTQFISNTAHQQGGGAYVGTTANLVNGLFNGNACTQAGCLGGGLYVFQTGPVSLSNTSFINNRSLSNGGGARTAGATALSGGQFQGNQCSETTCSGGGLYVAGSLALSGTQISNSQSGSDGAGAYATGALTGTNGLVQNNQCTQASCRGGGLFTGGALALTGTQVSNNSAGSNGAGAFATGPATLVGGQFQNNACTQTNCFGGGLYAQDLLSVTGATFSGNSAQDDGGGVWAGGNAVLAGGVFQNNACTQDNCRGGGLHAVQGLVLTSTQFLTNTARAGAGGAFGNVGAQSRLTNGLFLNNQCTQALCAGGGLDVLGSLALTGTQFLHNTATSSGGGLYTAGTATLDRAAFFDNIAVLGGGLYHGGTAGHVINSVFGNNLANNSGAAIFINTTGGHFILEQDTIAMPSFDVPTSSVQLLVGNVAVTNTIFINYDVGINRGTGSVYEDYNLFDHVGHPATGNVVSGGHSFNGAARPADPVFDNYHLLPGSGAVDRGVNDGVPIDYDGQARPYGRGYDIGYDEANINELFLPLAMR